MRVAGITSDKAVSRDWLLGATQLVNYGSQAENAGSIPVTRSRLDPARSSLATKAASRRPRRSVGGPTVRGALVELLVEFEVKVPDGTPAPECGARGTVTQLKPHPNDVVARGASREHPAS